MNSIDVQSFLGRDPFEPFTVVLSDGTEFEVLSRSLALLHPSGRSLHVVSPRFAGAKTDEDFEDHFVDTRHVIDLIKPARRLPSSKQVQE